MIVDDRYYASPAGNYDSRRLDFIDFSIQSYDPARAGRGGMFAQICHLERGAAVDESHIRDALVRVNERRDCSDFTVSGLLRILYQYRDELDDALVQAIQTTVLGFKYWMDEPGKNTMCFISENHQIMFHSDEYLAGQLFPDDIFADGHNGVQHRVRARERVLRWIDLKANTGFSEWDSNVYYDEDMAPLINLVDFADEPDVAIRAAMILDVMFFDMAVDSFRGTYGTTHGRSYPPSIVSGRCENTSSIQRIAWGMGCFNNPSNMTAVMLSTSRKYRVPTVIESIAQDMPEEITNRERQSYTSEDFERYGIRIDDPETAHLAWVVAKMASLDNTEALLERTEQHPSKWFDDVLRPLILRIREAYLELGRQGVDPGGQLDFLSLPAINKITYRTPDYQLSAAQDYRKGEPAWHQHLWQATLGSEAVVFTLHRSDNYVIPSRFWAGRFPRIAQHRNVLIALYDIPEHPVLGPGTDPIPETLLLHETIAHFPRSVFDEVREDSEWIMARKGDAYVALRSQRPVVWRSSILLDQEGLLAKGRQNVWLCQLGRKAVDGGFTEWSSKIASARLELEDLSARFEAPGMGEMQFSWDGPLRVNGAEIGLDDYPRFDNPYCCAEHGNDSYVITHGADRLMLDFGSNSRTEQMLA